MEPLPWFIVWAFLLPTMSGGVGSLETVQHFPTEKECKEQIAEHKDRMPDYIRGALKANLDLPIYVIGECKAKQTPA